MTRTARITEEDKCPRKWCQEAGEHEVHRHYLTSFMTADGRAIGVNVVQSGERPRAVELTMLSRQDPGETVVFQAADAELISKGMRAAVRIARR
ncbi:hypothetical protein [Jiangella anatolica]|uniref:Uncharacterized protein n=1 Tax=Jiangella anatolica TaxID=2670374 RepID=A0A2W2C011_9ACTN|nr:hypothetical protein [Jiangella anatolica]PZF86054.1 hypothetical protein C1I92_02390 [Jiangella anatolica]